MRTTNEHNGHKAGEEGAGYSAFFYGTLMAPEVFFTVCFRAARPPPAIVKEYTFRPAILHGYSRRRVKHADYPGIIEDKEHVVRGTYATGLTDANLWHLDYFEGSEYERRTVKLKLLDKVGDDKGQGNEEGGEVEAQVYVFKDASQLEHKEWDFEEFRREKMRKWTREDFVFDGCDPDQPATVAPSREKK